MVTHNPILHDLSMRSMISSNSNLNIECHIRVQWSENRDYFEAQYLHDCLLMEVIYWLWMVQPILHHLQLLLPWSEYLIWMLFFFSCCQLQCYSCLLSASWLKILSHSSECSFSSTWEASDVYSISPIVTVGFLFPVVASAT
jgi:hypothetical protein